MQIIQKTHTKKQTQSHTNYHYSNLKSCKSCNPVKRKYPEMLSEKTNPIRSKFTKSANSCSLVFIRGSNKMKKQTQLEVSLQNQQIRVH